MLDLESQTWLTTAEVDKTNWQHWVQVIVPDGPISSTALLYVTGGSTSGPPSGPDTSLASLAMQLGSIVVNLPTVPNQPLNFVGNPTNPASEDEIIAYTFEQYVNGDGNPDWPALLPMVQSAVSAMG